MTIAPGTLTVRSPGHAHVYIGGTVYKIIRFYRDPFTPSETILTGLTQAEAQAHCQDPQTSSRTCTTASGLRRTAEHGEWFDAWTDVI